jgi:FemAB-related protein (PEP-CTERM system-associated)
VNIRLAGESDLPAWQEFVDRAPAAHHMHHAGWYSVLRDAYWVTPYYLMACDGADALVGVLPLYFTRSPFTGRHLSSLEDGVLAHSKEVARDLIAEALALRDRLGARYLQIRGGPLGDHQPPARIPTVRTIIATERGIDALWSSIKKKTRWALRKVEQQPLTIEIDARLSRLRDFYEVYAAHMRSLGTPVMGFDGWAAMRRHLGPERLRLYLLEYRKALIGGMLCVVNGGGARWTDYLAIVRPSREIEFANYLLYWHVMRDAASRGATCLDLGRSRPGSNNHLFKRKWGGADTEVDYCFFPARGSDAKPLDLRPQSDRKGLAQRAWSCLPLALCNTLGPLIRKQLPFI